MLPNPMLENRRISHSKLFYRYKRREDNPTYSKQDKIVANECESKCCGHILRERGGGVAAIKFVVIVTI